MDGEDFQFNHVSKDDFDRTYKKIIRGRQKLKDDQQWNNYMESKVTDPTELNCIQNVTEIKHKKDLFVESTKKSLESHDSVNVLKLYNPNDRNHLLGLRSRLFITFNEFSTIVKNELLPPVSKSTKKVRIKYDQQADMDYITDLNLLFSEVRKESKNENVHKKLNKTNALLKSTFQTKLIQCYKLAIDAIKLCSKTLKAGVYNTVQSKMKSLIQIISTLSLITRKYLFGELFKKKKDESFDLVKHCKVLLNVLDEYGFEDIENDDYVCGNSVLHTYFKKGITKPKAQFLGANSNCLSMYKVAKPVIGSKYAREWSNRIQPSNNNEKGDELLCKESENESLVSNQIIKSAVEEYYPSLDDQTIILDKTDKESLFEDKAINVNYVYTNKKKIQPLPSENLHTTKLKTANNVGFYIVEDNRSIVDTVAIESETKKENPWKNFPLTDLNITPEGRLLLSIRPEEAKIVDSYIEQFRESKRPKTEMDMIFNVTESIKDDMLDEVLTKAIDGVIQMLIISELRNSF